MGSSALVLLVCCLCQSLAALVLLSVLQFERCFFWSGLTHTIRRAPRSYSSKLYLSFVDMIRQVIQYRYDLTGHSIYKSAPVSAGALLAYPRRYEQEKQVLLLLASTNAL